MCVSFVNVFPFFVKGEDNKQQPISRLPQGTENRELDKQGPLDISEVGPGTQEEQVSHAHRLHQYTFIDIVHAEVLDEANEKMKQPISLPIDLIHNRKLCPIHLQFLNTCIFGLIIYH